MTAYTLTAEQRERLLDAFDAVAGKGKRCEAAEKLLQSLQPNTQEPVAYEFRMRADWVPDWGLWSPCNKEQHEMYLRVPKLHDWIYETRALYTCPAHGVKP